MGGIVPRLIIQEVDGSPSGQPATLKMPNGTITDNGDGTFTYTAAGGSVVYLTSTIKAMAYKSGAQNISTVAKVQLDAESYDPGNNFDSATNYRFTVPTGGAGTFLVMAGLQINAMGAGKIFNMMVRKNGSDILTTTLTNVTNTYNAHNKICGIITLADADYLELFGQTDDSARAINQTIDSTFLAVHKISD